MEPIRQWLERHASPRCGYRWKLGTSHTCVRGQGHRFAHHCDCGATISKGAPSGIPPTRSHVWGETKPPAGERSPFESPGWTPPPRRKD